MKKIILIITSCIALNMLSQTFPIGHMSINFKDASRSGGYTISGGITMTGTGRTIGTEVYYPASVAGTNAPVAPGAQYPVVVFGDPPGLVGINVVGAGDAPNVHRLLPL